MKAVHSYDYRIDGYGRTNFIKVDIGSGRSTYKVFGGEKEQKKEPGLHG